MNDLIRLITLEWKEFMDFVKPLFLFIETFILKIEQ